MRDCATAGVPQRLLRLCCAMYGAGRVIVWEGLATQSPVRECVGHGARWVWTGAWHSESIGAAVVAKQQELREAFEESGFILATQARHLGVAVSCMARRVTRTQMERSRAGFKRLARLRQLRKAGGRIHKVVRAGPMASILWGSATAGIPLQQLHPVAGNHLK
eukprot:2321311-Amphidinium_carterae.1